MPPADKINATVAIAAFKSTCSATSMQAAAPHALPAKWTQSILPTLAKPLVTMAEVTEATTYSRASIYRLCAAGQFPVPLKLGSKVAFRSEEIDAWIASRPRALQKRGQD